MLAVLEKVQLKSYNNELLFGKYELQIIETLK